MVAIGAAWMVMCIQESLRLSSVVCRLSSVVCRLLSAVCRLLSAQGILLVSCTLFNGEMYTLHCKVGTLINIG